jgi:ubiquinone/menaquinone biosynthesis C-methylase UbiE
MMIESAGLPTDASVIDVGGGASTLVDDLLGHGFRNVTVLDISANALDKTKERLGNKAESVN